jgi:hypothetical protein
MAISIRCRSCRLPSEYASIQGVGGSQENRGMDELFVVVADAILLRD